jgi:multidrug efflux pump subunit AcrB
LKQPFNRRRDSSVKRGHNSLLPKTVSQAVSTLIEQQRNGVDNMIYMNSVSANNGVVQLFVDFDVKTDPNIDQVLAQLRVDQAQSQTSRAVMAICEFQAFVK